MTFVHLSEDDSLGAQRGELVVHIADTSRSCDAASALESVLINTEPGAARLVLSCDLNLKSTVARLMHEARRVSDRSHQISFMTRPTTAGATATLNIACGLASPADIVLLDGSAVVKPGWLDGLRAASRVDPRVATVSVLGDASGVLAPARLEDPAAPPDADQELWTGALEESRTMVPGRGASATYPDVPSPSRQCVLIRREALELVGGLDPKLSPGSALADLAQRALAHGMRNILADDVCVTWMSPRSPDHDEAFLEQRYPYRRPWAEGLAGEKAGHLADTMHRCGRVGHPGTVILDARCLGEVMTGTAVATVELIAALCAHTDLEVRALVLDECVADHRRLLEGLGARPVSIREADALPPSDVAHRHYQLGAPSDLLLLRRLGERVVVTHQDSIAYRTPSYFEDYTAWRAYRELTQASLAAADQVVFLSAHGAEDARLLGLVDERRISVIPHSVDHVLGAPRSGARPPADAIRLGDAPYLLCLGTDFTHKNRRFAIRLLDALLTEDLFDGLLVLAGPHVGAGSSADEEAAYLTASPHLVERVIDLGAVSDSEKDWLLAGAAAVVVPSTYEGFGLVPFEAARAGVPALFAWTTSLRDLLPEDLALLVPWDARESARRAAAVLVPGEAREHQVSGVTRAGAGLTAARQARRYADVYESAQGAGAGNVGRVAYRNLELLAERTQLENEIGLVRHELNGFYEDPIARGLVGRYAIVPEEIQRLALAVAGRPAMRRAAVRLYRAARRRQP